MRPEFRQHVLHVGADVWTVMFIADDICWCSARTAIRARISFSRGDSSASRFVSRRRGPQRARVDHVRPASIASSASAIWATL